MAFNYVLEFDKDINQSWIRPSWNNYDSNNIEDSTDEKVDFALSVIDRIIVYIGVERCEIELFKELIKKLIDNIYKCFLMGKYMHEDCLKKLLEDTKKYKLLKRLYLHLILNRFLIWEKI